MDTAEKSIFDIMQKRHSEQFHHIRDIAVSSIEKIEDIYRSKGKLTGVPTGFWILMPKRQVCKNQI